MPRRTVLLVPAALAVALTAPSAAVAAPNACRAHADHSRVLAESNSGLVYARRGGGFKPRAVRACAFRTPRRVYRLPDQDGGNANRLHSFRFNGRYLGWVMTNAEEASPTATSFVYSADLRRRRKLLERASFAEGTGDDTTTEVTGLVIGAKGAIAWINDSINLSQKLSVRAVAPGARRVRVLDRGNAIRRRSLGIGADNATIYWMRGSAAKSAALIP
jgi:hypothetical protein